MASQKSRKTQKPLSPARFRKQIEKHYKKQPELLKGKKLSSNASGRAKHYAKGDKLMKQVALTLNKVAASHPNPNARKQAKDALKKLGAAQNEFGTACMCQTISWGQDDT